MGPTADPALAPTFQPFRRPPCPSPVLFRGELRELDVAECRELLGTKKVGRVAYCGSDGPEVLPMNYVVADESLLFRTSPSSALGHRLRVDVAAFQVDEVDDYTESGWSVLLRGTVARRAG